VVDDNFNPIPGLYHAGNTVGYRFGDDYDTVLHGGSNGMAACRGNIVGESAANA
jgi:fumarate reductase flavoprotein subunit